MNHKVPRVQLVKLKDIFHPTFEKNGVRNRSDIAKCLERLNGSRKTLAEPYGKSALSRTFTGLFDEDSFSNRLERSPSSDSIGVSNFSSSDQGSDSCNYSSHGSDSNSGSAPCSPEEPDGCCSGEESPSTPSSSSDIVDSDTQPGVHQSTPEPDRTNIPSGCISSIEQKFNIFCSGDDFSFSDSQKLFRSSDIENSHGISDNQMLLLSSDTKDNLNSSECQKLFSSSDTKDGLEASESHKIFCPEDNIHDLLALENREPVSTGDNKDSLWNSDCQNLACSGDAETDLRTSDSQKLFYLRDWPVPNSTCDSSTFQKGDIPQTSNTSNVGDVFKSVADPCSKAKQVKSSSKSVEKCMWMHCQCCLEGNAELVEHIKTQHVLTQNEKETFVCLWSDCKVYNRPSSSLSWLERHILKHTGIKPFKCIVDKCSQRFHTQAALQRHVNHHFDSSNQHGKTGKCREDAKSLRRKKYLKNKKRSAIVGKTAEDFFDPCVMEQIRYNLVGIHSNNPFGTSSCGGMVTFQSKIKAIKRDSCGEVQVLVQWIPENILPDSWVLQKNVPKSKQVSYALLPKNSLHLSSLVKSTEEDDQPKVKHRRK